MSDNDDSFYDSFESGSDSDHADGPGEDGFVHMNVTIDRSSLRTHTTFSSSGEGYAGLEVSRARKDPFVFGNERTPFDSLSDHDDWR
jgi:hypothetical protein